MLGTCSCPFEITIAEDAIDITTFLEVLEFCRKILQGMHTVTKSDFLSKNSQKWHKIILLKSNRSYSGQKGPRVSE